MASGAGNRTHLHPARLTVRQNGYVESLNASLGRELLDREIFENMQHLQTRLEQWRREYNEERPHGSCGNIHPSLYAGQLQPSTLTITKPNF